MARKPVVQLPLAAPDPVEALWRRALGICRGSGRICPHGCAKDGAPNCRYHVVNAACSPGRDAARETSAAAAPAGVA